MRYEIWDTPLNKSLAQFAHWANKEQIAKRKEHPSVHGTDGCYLLFEKNPADWRDFLFHKNIFFLAAFLWATACCWFICGRCQYLAFCALGGTKIITQV